tara:strand:- start:1184 stop:1576 length:393 start_codon:yes stop_codon:yes gene_type:complete
MNTNSILSQAHQVSNTLLSTKGKTPKEFVPYDADAHLPHQVLRTKDDAKGKVLFMHISQSGLPLKKTGKDSKTGKEITRKDSIEQRLGTKHINSDSYKINVMRASQASALFKIVKSEKMIQAKIKRTAKK